MEKIFFYANIMVGDLTIGITKKVFSQIANLRDMGYEVFYTGYTCDGVAIFNNNDEIIRKLSFSDRTKRINRFLRRWVLLKFASKFIEETEDKFKYGYLRFHFFDRAYLRLLKALKKKQVITIVEAHAYPYKIGKPNRLTPIYIIDTLYTPFVRKYIDLVAAICNAENIWGIKTVNIDNAIDLNSVSLSKKVQESLIPFVC